TGQGEVEMIPLDLAMLANHLWQSTLFTAVVWLITLCLRRNRAAVRHWLWLAASVKFLIPFSILVGIGSYFETHTASVTASPQVATIVGTISQPFAALAPSLTPVKSIPASQPGRISVLLFGV